MGKNITNQKEPEQGALCSPTKPELARDRAPNPFPRERQVTIWNLN